MQIILNIKNTENVGTVDKERFEEIFNALITSGGLTGVRGGKTIIHFDADGNFMAVQLDYYPYRRRKA